MNTEEIDWYLDRLSELELELANHRRQLLNLSNQYRKEKIESLYNAEGATVAERQNMAEYQVLDLRNEIETFKYSIQCREDERDHIRFLLSVKVSTRVS